VEELENSADMAMFTYLHVELVSLMGLEEKNFSSTMVENDFFFSLELQCERLVCRIGCTEVCLRVRFAVTWNRGLKP